MQRRLLTLLLVSVGVASQALAQVSAAVLPWEELHPGRYEVGYQVQYLLDGSRTWRTTRPYGKPFSPDTMGRPVRVSIWFPAMPTAGAKPMHVVDFVRNAPPENLKQADGFLEARDRRVLAEMVPAEAFQALLQTPMRSYMDAVPAAGRFPLVLYSGGVNSYTLSNVFIAELLASHGYVVATVPSLGPSDQQPEQVFSPAEVEASVRDLEFAWAALRRLPFVDQTRLAVFGHSLGGTVATLFALRNSDVLAVAGLDGTYGFGGEDPARLINHPNYQPQRMRAAFLDVHRNGPKLDFTVLDSFHFADRYYLTLANVLHGDFTSFVVVARAFKLPPPENPPVGWTRETGYLGFQATCKLLLAFFDANLKGIPTLDDSLRNLAESGVVATLAHKPALPAPPSAAELAGLLEVQGYDATIQLIDRIRVQAPGVAVVDAQALNTMGYGLMTSGMYQRAIEVLRLVVHVYPESANAHDSLGDAYLAAGDRARAREEFQQALTLAPADSSLAADSRSSLIQLERKKLSQLKP